LSEPQVSMILLIDCDDPFSGLRNGHVVTCLCASQRFRTPAGQGGVWKNECWSVWVVREPLLHQDC